MADASTTLSIIVKLQDEASAAMQGLGSNLKSIGDSMSSVGKAMTTDITLPLVGFATYAAKGAMDFQQAMTLVQTQAGATASEVQGLSDQVMQLAEHSQQGPTELANGLYHLISLGVNAQDAMAALKVSSEGAAVGQEDLEQITTALGGAISSGIKGVSDYSATMGMLDATVGAGNMKMSDLVGALGTGILPAARSAGLSLTDVSAALATMTDNGVPAEDAATRLRMTFSLMAAPTQAAQKALSSVGISSTQLATDMRQPNGLLVAIQDLKAHLEDSGKTAVEQNAVIAAAFGGGRTSSSIETLLEETDKLSSKYTYLATNTDKFTTSVQVEASTWQGQLQNMDANLEVFRDTVGKSLLQVANQVFPIVTNLLQDLLDEWNHLSPGMQKAIIIFAGVAAALGPILVIVGSLITAVGSIIGFIGGFVGVMGTITTAAGPVIAAIGAVVAAIGIWPIVIGAIVVALVVLIVTHWTQIKDFLTTVGGDILAVLTKTWNAIKDVFVIVWDSIVDSIKFNINLAVSILTTAWNIIKDVTTTIWNGIMEFIKFSIDFIVGLIVLDLNALDPNWRAHWQAIADFFTQTWNTIKAEFSDIWDWITSFFNSNLSKTESVWNVVWKSVSDVFMQIWNAIKSFINELWNWIAAIFNTTLSGIETLWNTVWNAISTVFIGIWGGVKNALSTTLTFLRSQIETFVNWAEGAFKPVQTAVSAIGGAVSGFMGSVKSGVGAVAGIGSEITHFATGGIVNGPTIALVGEAGPEAIIPLSSFNHGMSLARGGGSGSAVINITIAGGNYLDSQGATMIANELAKQVVRQVRVANYAR